MITTEAAAQLLTGEVEDCLELLGGRAVGGGLYVDSIRVAIGQTGDVDAHEVFLLTEAAEAAEGRPGWAVEVRLQSRPEEQPGVPYGPAPGSSGHTPLSVLGEEPTTILRGVDADTAEELSELGLDTVAALATLPEWRLPELVGDPTTGMRLLDAWSRAQLLRLPLGTPLVGGPGGWTLAEAAGASPAQLREAGLPSAMPESQVEGLARSLALLGAALDLRILRTTTLSMVAPPVGEVDR